MHPDPHLRELLATLLADQDATGLFPTLRAPPDAGWRGWLDPAGAVRLDSPFVHTYVVEALLPHHRDPAVGAALRRAVARLITMATPHPAFGLEWRFFVPGFAPILPDTDVLSRCLLVLWRAGRLGLADVGPDLASGFRRVLDHTAAVGAGDHVALTWLGERPDNDVDPVVNANLLLAARTIGWSHPLTDAVARWLRARLRAGGAAWVEPTGYYDRPGILPYTLSRIHALDGSFAGEEAAMHGAVAEREDALDEALALAVAGQLGEPVVCSAAMVRALTQGPVCAFFKQRTPRLVYGSRALQCAIALQGLDGRAGLRAAGEG